ncbi:MAG: 50S ribosomal protein L24e [Candidatus Thermoplasmatota archaeon]|nr:50S ribosomal protein L24e [Candidatus Thermoplasmatota archaeon]
MAVRNCSFCGSIIEPGAGTVYIKRDGSYYNFCSRKCRVNMLNLKRVPRRVRWTSEFRNAARGKKSAAKGQ